MCLLVKSTQEKLIYVDYFTQFRDTKSDQRNLLNQVWISGVQCVLSF